MIANVRTERQVRQSIEPNEARVEPIFVSVGSFGGIDLVGGEDNLEEMLFTLWARDVEHERDFARLDSQPCFLEYLALGTGSGSLIAVRRSSGDNPGVVVISVAKQHALVTLD